MKRSLSALRLMGSFQLKEIARLAERTQINTWHIILKRARCLLRQMTSRATLLMEEAQIHQTNNILTRWIPPKPIRLYISSKRTAKYRKIQVPKKIFCFTLGRKFSSASSYQKTESSSNVGTKWRTKRALWKLSTTCSIPWKPKKTFLPSLSQRSCSNGWCYHQWIASSRRPTCPISAGLKTPIKKDTSIISSDSHPLFFHSPPKKLQPQNYLNKLHLMAGHVAYL